MQNFINKIKNSRYLPDIKFIIFYTLLFIAFVYTAKYTTPFLIGLAFAALVQPLYRFMRKKLSFKGGFAAAVLTTLIFVIIIAFICWVIFTAIKEIVLFITSLNDNSLPISSLISQLINSFESFLGDGFIKIEAEKIIEYFSAGVEAVGVIYNYISALFTSIPAIFTMIVVAVFSTYYFTYDFEKIKKLIIDKLSFSQHKKLSKLYSESAMLLKKFFRSYTVIYSLTFLETLLVFIIFKIKYPVFFAVLTAVADVIPILGPGTIYIPLGLIYLFSGDFFKAIVIFVSFALISLIRQFIEPKIVSDSIKIHPLLMLAAIYFSLLAKSLWVLIYLVVLFLLYQVFVRARLIYPLFGKCADTKE